MGLCQAGCGKVVYAGIKMVVVGKQIVEQLGCHAARAHQATASGSMYM